MRSNVRTVTGTLPTMAAAVAPPPGSGPPKGGRGPSGSGRARFLSSCIYKKAVTMAFLAQIRHFFILSKMAVETWPDFSPKKYLQI
jgi:hypothetical protein